jgi:hypothetical protein
MSDRFESVWQKIDRARRHADDLEAEITAFRASKPYQIEMISSPVLSNDSYRLKSARPLPPSIPLIVGDAAHNIRSALDHLAWAVVSERQRSSHTQFPIWVKNDAPKPGKWREEVDRRLNGAPYAMIAAVYELSPWETGLNKDLWAVHELDRIDKHRLLLSVAATNTEIIFEAKGVMGIVHQFSGGREGMPVAIVPKDWRPVEVGMILWPANQFDVEPSHFEFDVTFGEPKILSGRRVVPELRILAGHVEDAIHKLAALA